MGYPAPQQSDKDYVPPPPFNPSAPPLLEELPPAQPGCGKCIHLQKALDEAEIIKESCRYQCAVLQKDKNETERKCEFLQEQNEELKRHIKLLQKKMSKESMVQTMNPHRIVSTIDSDKIRFLGGRLDGHEYQQLRPDSDLFQLQAATYPNGYRKTGKFTTKTLKSNVWVHSEDLNPKPANESDSSGFFSAIGGLFNRQPPKPITYRVIVQSFKASKLSGGWFSKVKWCKWWYQGTLLAGQKINDNPLLEDHQRIYKRSIEITPQYESKDGKEWMAVNKIEIKSIE